MKGKHKGRKMALWRRAARLAIGGIGAVTGILVATAPVHKGLKTLAKGDFSLAADEVTYETTGLSTSNPSAPLDASKVVRTGVLVGVGIGLISLFRYLAKKV